MPLYAPSALNVVDTNNSTTTPLGPGGVFQGAFTEVLDFTAVSVLIFSDRPSAVDGVRLQWSTDGVNVDYEPPQFYSGGVGQPFLATVQGRYFRVRYTNSSFVQTTFRLQTLLRSGTPTSTITSISNPSSASGQDVLSVRAVLHARSISAPTGTMVLPFATGDPFLIVHNPPSGSTQVDRIVVASALLSQQLDFFGLFGATRHMLTIFNDTKRGILYMKLGGAASLLSYHQKILPQHTWEIPITWRRYSGTVHGIWDVADGSAYIREHF